MVQFKGVFLVFWLVVFVIVGIVSVVVPNMPKGAEALWALLGIYVCITAAIHLKFYKKEARIKRLESEFRAQRREMIQQTLIEQHVFHLPEDHYFEIKQDPTDHTPIVTLLPPPPTYT
jgi:amino acid permease